MQDYGVERRVRDGQFLSIHYIRCDVAAELTRPALHAFDHCGRNVSRYDFHTIRDERKIGTRSAANDQEAFSAFQFEQINGAAALSTEVHNPVVHRGP